MVPFERRGGTAPKAATVEGLSRATAWVVLVLACVVLTGWAFDLTLFTSVFPGYNTMKLNTAVCLLALAAVLLVGRRLAWFSLLAVGLIAGATMLEIWTGRSFGIDELVVRDLDTPAANDPGRMAPAAAVGLLSLTVALALLLTRRTRAAEAVLVVPMVIAVTSLLGYLYGVEQLYRVVSQTSIAVHTGFALLLLTVAAGARIPGGIVPWLVVGRGPGAAVVRQTAPVIAGGLIALGLIRRRLGDAGVFGERFGIAVMVMFSIGLSVGATMVAAKRLDAADRARVEAESAVRDLNRSLVEGRDEAWARAERLGGELASERLRFDRAISSTDSVVWTVETTSGAPEPVYASPNAERVLGAPLLPGETAIAALARLVDEDQRETALDFRSSVWAGVPAEAEVRTSVGGGPKWLRIHGVPRREGERTFYDGIIIDSSEQHALGEQRELLLRQEHLHVQRLSGLDRVRNDFIAVAGHELRTPVAVILGYCELLADPRTTAEKRTESIDVIVRRAQQLSDLVERVFDLARIDAGAMDLYLEPVQVADFVADLLEEHRPAAEAVGVDLAMSVVPATVLADRPRLQQVLDNLLANALKYTPEGGHVAVRVGTCEDAVVLEIADDGIGVAPDELPRLFDRLFRATNARDSRIPGTGLGLAVTKALVEAHGGTITARANEPRGLVFSVSLPSADGPVLAGTA